MVQVVSQASQQHGSEFNLSNDRVTASAQQTANSAGCVAVIHDENAISGVAEKAALVLGGAELVDLARGEPVLAHETSTKILRSCGGWVASTPVAEAFVPALPIGGSVLAVPLADARAALAPASAPVRERFIGPVHATYPTLHTQQSSAVAWHGWSKSEPCHADVLLELANPSSPVGVDASLPGSATDGAVADGPVAGSTPISPSVSPATGPRTERTTK